VAYGLPRIGDSVTITELTRNILLCSGENGLKKSDRSEVLIGFYNGTNSSPTTTHPAALLAPPSWLCFCRGLLVCLSVRLSVCQQDYSKVMDEFLSIFQTSRPCKNKQSALHFWGDLDYHAFRSRNLVSLEINSPPLRSICIAMGKSTADSVKI